MCKCIMYTNMWFNVQNRLAYYKCIVNSPCGSKCKKACAEIYIKSLELQLKKVEAILKDLNCPGFTNRRPKEEEK